MQPMTLSAFARYMDWPQSYVSKLKKAGRLVLDDNGRVLPAPSIARIEATSDPSKKGVAQRHAQARAAKAQSAEPALPAPAVADDGKAGAVYQKAKAMREQFLALEARRIYELNIGKLCDVQEASSIAFSAMNEIRMRHAALPALLAPRLVSMSNEAEIMQLIREELEQIEAAAADHFNKLGSKPNA